MAGVPMRLTQHSGQGRLGHVNHGHGSHGGHSGHGGHGGHGGHNHGGHGHGMMLQPHQAHQPHQPHQAHQPHQYSPAQGVIVTMGGGHMGPGPQGGHMSAGPGAPQGGHMSGEAQYFSTFRSNMFCNLRILQKLWFPQSILETIIWNYHYWE